MTREQWRSYIEAAQHRVVRPEAFSAEQTERQQLLKRVSQAATELKSRFETKRVILFGSLANADWFAPDSDVDLAVEGLAPDSY